MNKEQASQSIRSLGMTQLTVCRLAKIQNDRLSRFLSGFLELRPDELERLNDVINTAFLVESGAGRLGALFPVDWSRVSADPQLEEFVFTVNDDE